MSLVRRRQRNYVFDRAVNPMSEHYCVLSIRSSSIIRRSTLTAAPGWPGVFILRARMSLELSCFYQVSLVGKIKWHTCVIYG